MPIVIFKCDYKHEPWVKEPDASWAPCVLSQHETMKELTK